MSVLLPMWLSLKTLLATINWREALIAAADVVIIFYILYRALKLVRGTRAAQAMTGLALITGLYFLAKRLDLVAVSWLFENLINYFIIFFVVLFQQDIRRALMQVGQNLFMRRQYEETYVIEEVVQAAGELARQKIGALIVLERDADLTDHLGEVGQDLDAKVTKELLVTLFLPEPANHLHDGAVIIRNLRIAQAGAVLPLSANSKLDKELGTRHRAAVGVTEETDAVVVVVSEERGTISVCFSGNIIRDLDALNVRKALLGLFQKKKAKGKDRPAGRGGKADRSGNDISLGGVPLPSISSHSSGQQSLSSAPAAETSGSKQLSELQTLPIGSKSDPTPSKSMSELQTLPIGSKAEPDKLPVTQPLRPSGEPDDDSSGRVTARLVSDTSGPILDGDTHKLPALKDVPLPVSAATKTE